MVRAPQCSVPFDAVATAARILIVDDDATVADWFSRTMRLNGHEVWTAQSSGEGLALAQTHRPHAVIFDVRTPLASGVRFLRAVRAIPGLLTAPIAIVTSDYAQDEAQMAEIEALGAELRYRPQWLNELVALAHELLAPPVQS
jgi:DNA-binding response OmpR family regulator